LTHARSFSVNLYTGTSSMLAAALGLAPSKDTWWSEKTFAPPNPKYPSDARENFPAVEAAVATFTAGPVQPGDSAGHTNRPLVMCSCTKDGTLLKPAWPATPVDAYFSFRAGISTAGPDGEVYATHSVLDTPSGDAPYIVVHALAIDLKADYSIPLRDLTHMPLDPRMSYFSWSANTASCSESLPADVLVQQGATALDLHACGKADFRLVHAAPAVQCGTEQLGLLGEAGKWVPVSRQRFGRPFCRGDSLAVPVFGTPGEKVDVRFARHSDGAVHAAVLSTGCVFDPSGKAVATSAGTCDAGHVATA